jgi:hypothetical protein
MQTKPAIIALGRPCMARGTGSSNPFPSSKESTNFQSLSWATTSFIGFSCRLFLCRNAHHHRTLRLGGDEIDVFIRRQLHRSNAGGGFAVDEYVGIFTKPSWRTTLIQLAWLWLRNQPQSALTIWFHERVLRNGGRLRKTTIVALARKLLVALWKYVTTGVVIEGATMKAP